MECSIVVLELCYTVAVNLLSHELHLFVVYINCESLWTGVLSHKLMITLREKSKVLFAKLNSEKQSELTLRN